MIECRVEKFVDSTNFPHKLSKLTREHALLLQNFLNTLAIEQLMDSVNLYWDNNSNLWVSHEEYQALLDNAELLGIKFIVEK